MKRRLVSFIPYNGKKFIVGEVYDVVFISSENIYVIHGDNGIIHLSKDEVETYFSREECPFCGNTDVMDRSYHAEHGHSCSDCGLIWTDEDTIDISNMKQQSLLSAVQYCIQKNKEEM